MCFVVVPPPIVVKFKDQNVFDGGPARAVGPLAHLCCRTVSDY